MLVALFRLFSILPLPLLHLLGVLLGVLVYAVSPTYRQRLKHNLKQAGFGAHLWSAICESGKSIAELPFVWCAPQARVNRHCQIENPELIRQMQDAGQCVIFLTPHLGCFELTAQMIARQVRLTAMYRPPRKAFLRPLIEGARMRANLHLAPATLAGVRILARELKAGHAVGILPDQTPQEGEGIWADFFGRAAYTMTLPAKLARMSAATFVLTYAERLPWGRGFVVRFVPFGTFPDGPSTPGQSASPQDLLQQQCRAINAAMEQLIARCPAQYAWSYNRYKSPPGVTKPGTAPATAATVTPGMGSSAAAQSPATMPPPPPLAGPHSPHKDAP